MNDSNSPDDQLQAITQNIEEAKRLLDRLNEILIALIQQCETPIANRLLDETVGYLLVNVRDGITYAIGSLNNVLEQEQLLQPDVDQRPSDDQR